MDGWVHAWLAGWQVDEFSVGKGKFFIVCLTDVTAINEAMQTNQLVGARPTDRLAGMPDHAPPQAGWLAG